MALIVFDMGRRIDTPFNPVRNRINAVSASAATHSIEQSHNYGGNDSSYAVNAYLNQEEKQPDNVAIINEIMHRSVRTFTPTTTLKEALITIQKTGFHHFPVINPEHQVLAIFSDYDLLHALVKRTPASLDEFWNQNVMSIAVHPVLCVQENTDIRQASNLLYEYNIDALPVLNSRNELCGIITRSDILKLISHYGPMELWA